MKHRVTLDEIARQSGVSVATVSLVLRGKPGVNEETRRRVLESARLLGYRRRPAVESAPEHGLRQVGMVVKARMYDQPHANPFYGPVMAAIEEACRRQQINLLYATMPVDADNHPQELPRMLLEDELDGLLFIGAFVDATITQLMERRTMPTVLVDAYVAENGSAPGCGTSAQRPYDVVVSDNFSGAYQAVSYLIGRGHRHIGLVGSLPNAYPSIAERRRGYLQALQDHGIAQPYFADSHIPDPEAAAAAIDLLQRCPQITALFCCNDAMAITVMKAAQTLGRRLPDDLSIIGFDNIDLAEHVTPSLTTMHVDKLSMGRLAVQLLINRAEFPTASCITATIQPTLVERQSACSPRDKRKVESR